MLGVVFLAAYFAVVAVVDDRQENKLYQSRLESRKVIFASFVELASHPLETFAYDYTFWDDMVTFIEGGGKDVQWGQENIDPGLDTFSTNVVWAYTTSGKLIYSVDNLDTDDSQFEPSANEPIKAGQFQELFKSNGVFHYFVKTDSGIFEIYASTVHPTADDQRVTPPRGYFFVGKHLEDEYLKQAGDSIEGKTELFDNAAGISNLDTRFNERTGKIAFVEELKDFNDQTVGALYATYTAADLRDALIIQDKLTLLGISTIFGLTLILLLPITAKAANNSTV